ncbi:MAG: hypothetical protein SCARUB_01346 [Candidatus Scalindua rubra]|uniref:Uncharacterized protein n=1 Tax=Candidatus Scalindua rubra TaxID=1872076 RepID=A0A1E3XD19_9BACT|nr:MAG: hypothetical protein SCARUB_01346 [Candidatus Scalindua rubra]
MTPREKELLLVIEGFKDKKATPRQICGIMSLTTGYAEQLCNILVRKKKLFKAGKFFQIPVKEHYAGFGYAEKSIE